ncbi:hypothetical protein N7510_004783 [Penicillium lagena]|uniref:uncharacterized protein n=1 Tax=Penicillium lagena TaxID=94218 RepID=UPI002540ACCE|nr:uncharacterized protein N7510_004783 [Penicillium lagena]KAJ5620799.1 hypothetical protein N7510_004783 [Penicillium lagena]
MQKRVAPSKKLYAAPSRNQVMECIASTRGRAVELVGSATPHRAARPERRIGAANYSGSYENEANGA